jgi:hypothetical protein
LTRFSEWKELGRFLEPAKNGTEGSHKKVRTAQHWFALFGLVGSLKAKPYGRQITNRKSGQSEQAHQHIIHWDVWYDSVVDELQLSYYLVSPW